MTPPAASINAQFDWQTQPRACAFIHETVGDFCRLSAGIARLADRLLDETGTRITDWIDHLCLPDRSETTARLQNLGFAPIGTPEGSVWRHAGGMFPRVITCDQTHRTLAIKVDSVVDFLFAQQLPGADRIRGSIWSDHRIARIEQCNEVELLAIESNGYRFPGGGQATPPVENVENHATAVARHFEAFRLRRREFDESAAGFEHAAKLIDRAIDDLGPDRACHWFFAAEREFWQSRNRAARVQRGRQDRLGLGWANHDHHTYRSSRAEFARLIAVLEKLGFQCRERFYGGLQAGWGAQVLEQPHAGIVVFADVDLTPGEVAGDFAHEGLPPAESLGTVGLWCALHGEAFLQAGMHHLECQFDFDAARAQLAREGVRTMKPFTDFPHLRQAFTEGEIWPVRGDRIDRLLADGRITHEQASRFHTAGSLGSHLEILQRDDGYKGFNQTGISEIIRDTDPRTQRALT